MAGRRSRNLLIRGTDVRGRYRPVRGPATFKNRFLGPFLDDATRANVSRLRQIQDLNSCVGLSLVRAPEGHARRARRRLHPRHEFRHVRRVEGFEREGHAPSTLREGRRLRREGGLAPRRRPRQAIGARPRRRPRVVALVVRRHRSHSSFGGRRLAELVEDGTLSSSSSASPVVEARPGASRRTLASWRASGRGWRRLKVWASWTQGGGAS